MTDINEFGELASWETSSREYKNKIKKLTRKGRRFPRNGAMSAFQAGLLTWEHARAEMGIESDTNDPRWGRFFVPGQFSFKDPS